MLSDGVTIELYGDSIRHVAPSVMTHDQPIVGLPPYLRLVLAPAVTHIGQQRIVACPLDTGAGVRGQGVAALALVPPIHLT